jgi:hypothetical protein
MMRDIIVKILNEQKKERFLEDIEKLGLFQFMKMTGLSYTKIWAITSGEFTNKVMIDFIKDIVREYGSFSVYDIDENPIFYFRFGDAYKEITYFSYQRVSVDVFSGNNNLGNFHVHYENLGDDMLTNVFELIVKAYESGKLENI